MFFEGMSSTRILHSSTRSWSWELGALHPVASAKSCLTTWSMISPPAEVKCSEAAASCGDKRWPVGASSLRNLRQTGWVVRRAVAVALMWTVPSTLKGRFGHCKFSVRAGVSHVLAQVCPMFCISNVTGEGLKLTVAADFCSHCSRCGEFVTCTLIWSEGLGKCCFLCCPFPIWAARDEVFPCCVLSCNGCHQGYRSGFRFGIVIVV